MKDSVNHEIQFPPLKLKNRDKKEKFYLFNNNSKDFSRCMIVLFSIVFLIQGVFQVLESARLLDASIGTYDTEYDQ